MFCFLIFLHKIFFTKLINLKVKEKKLKNLFKVLKFILNFELVIIYHEIAAIVIFNH